MAVKPLAEKAKAEKYMVGKLYRESYGNGEYSNENYGSERNIVVK